MDKEQILAFYQGFFNGKDLSLAESFVAEGYVQHNPSVGQGRKGLVEAFQKKFASGDYFHLLVDQVICDQDYIAVFLRSVTEDGWTKARVVDLYRVENGLLAEHWDYFDKGER